ncbi:MAG: type II toxin-antitoxin system ParD family antitoxin [Orrella sp.]|jgi:antitoxin ParD1/3/4|uniref:type II toxin-antitoxin system ParD family antitoxin n=1 Tax=Orrella sp. TaxID=1921583 RepID=UPI003BEC42AC
MHVSLTPELESRVRAKVDSGLYNNASEVVREALRFMDSHEQWVHEIKMAQLREQLQLGTNQLDQGLGIPVETEVELDAIFLEIRGNTKA